MSHQFLAFAGGLVNSDTANGANRVVEADSNGDIFINGVNANTYLKVLGNLFGGSASYSASNTLGTTAATVIIADATAGVMTLTLPASAASTNQFYFIFKKDSSANAVTVKGSGAELINGANTFALSSQYSAVLIWCNGTQWYIFATH